MIDVEVLAIVVVLLLTGAFFAVVLRGKRRVRTAGAAPVVWEPAAHAGESDAERRERLLTDAFRAGEIPAVWYRQQMAVLAADTADQEPRV